MESKIGSQTSSSHYNNGNHSQKKDKNTQKSSHTRKFCGKKPTQSNPLTQYLPKELTTEQPSFAQYKPIGYIPNIIGFFPPYIPYYNEYDYTRIIKILKDRSEFHATSFHALYGGPQNEVRQQAAKDNNTQKQEFQELVRSAQQIRYQVNLERFNAFCKRFQKEQKREANLARFNKILSQNDADRNHKNSPKNAPRTPLFASKEEQHKYVTELNKALTYTANLKRFEQSIYKKNISEEQQRKNAETAQGIAEIWHSIGILEFKKANRKHRQLEFRQMELFAEEISTQTKNILRLELPLSQKYDKRIKSIKKQKDIFTKKLETLQTTLDQKKKKQIKTEKYHKRLEERRIQEAIKQEEERKEKEHAELLIRQEIEKEAKEQEAKEKLESQKAAIENDPVIRSLFEPIKNQYKHDLSHKSQKTYNKIIEICEWLKPHSEKSSESLTINISGNNKSTTFSKEIEKLFKQDVKPEVKDIIKTAILNTLNNYKNQCPFLIASLITTNQLVNLGIPSETIQETSLYIAQKEEIDQQETIHPATTLLWIVDRFNKETVNALLYSLLSNPSEILIKNINTSLISSEYPSSAFSIIQKFIVEQLNTFTVNDHKKVVGIPIEDPNSNHLQPRLIQLKDHLTASLLAGTTHFKEIIPILLNSGTTSIDQLFQFAALNETLRSELLSYITQATKNPASAPFALSHILLKIYNQQSPTLLANSLMPVFKSNDIAFLVFTPTDLRDKPFDIFKKLLSIHSTEDITEYLACLFLRICPNISPQTRQEAKKTFVDCCNNIIENKKISLDAKIRTIVLMENTNIPRRDISPLHTKIKQNKGEDLLNRDLCAIAAFLPKINQFKNTWQTCIDKEWSIAKQKELIDALGKEYTQLLTKLNSQKKETIDQATAKLLKQCYQDSFNIIIQSKTHSEITEHATKCFREAINASLEALKASRVSQEEALFNKASSIINNENRTPIESLNAMYAVIDTPLDILKEKHYELLETFLKKIAKANCNTKPKIANRLKDLCTHFSSQNRDSQQILSWTSAINTSIKKVFETNTEARHYALIGAIQGLTKNKGLKEALSHAILDEDTVGLFRKINETQEIGKSKQSDILELVHANLKYVTNSCSIIKSFVAMNILLQEQAELIRQEFYDKSIQMLVTHSPILLNRELNEEHKNEITQIIKNALYFDVIKSNQNRTKPQAIELPKDTQDAIITFLNKYDSLQNLANHKEKKPLLQSCAIFSSFFYCSENKEIKASAAISFFKIYDKIICQYMDKLDFTKQEKEYLEETFQKVNHYLVTKSLDNTEDSPNCLLT